MKRYIRCDSSRIELPPINIVVEIDFCVESDITSATSSESPQIISNRDLMSAANSAFSTYMQSIIDVIEGSGFTEISRRRSPSSGSQSTYYTFCYLDDAYIQRVNMIFVFRVSNHNLTMKPWDRTPDDPIRRQKNYYRGHIQQYRWMSDSGRAILLSYQQIKYNGNYYDNMNQILEMVETELDNFKAAHPLSADGYEVITIRNRFNGIIPSELDVIQSRYEEFGDAKRFNTYDGAESYLYSQYSYYDEESDGYYGYVALIRKTSDPDFIVSYLSYDGAVVDTSYLIT